MHPENPGSTTHPEGKIVDIQAARRASTSDDAPGEAPAGEERRRRRGERMVDWGNYNWLVQNVHLVYGTDIVWDAANRMEMKISALAHAHGGDVVKLWKASDSRRTVMPGEITFDPTGRIDQKLNRFDGIELEPRKGDVEPILQLVQFLTSRASDNADECDQVMHWLLCWMAYPLQHVGTKLRTAIVMHGDEGAGKNFLFDLWVEIYGKYGALVGQDELEDKFNDWRSAKLAIVGDEVSSRQELVHNKNRLKALITSPTVQINPKNLPRRVEPNHINIVFLSNELQPLALDNSDRRYLVIYTPRAREFEFYRQLKAWRENGGVAAFYDYLLQYPLADFDPFAPAPMTQAKMDLIDMNLKSPERFWIEWAGGELRLPYRTCSVAQAYRAYRKYADRTGERFPAHQSVFMRMVMRIAEARAPAMNLPVPQLWKGDVEHLDGETRDTRMFLVKAAPDGVAKGQWASEALAQFEKDLAKYAGGPRPHGSAEPVREAEG